MQYGSSEEKSTLVEVFLNLCLPKLKGITHVLSRNPPQLGFSTSPPNFIKHPLPVLPTISKVVEPKVVSILDLRGTHASKSISTSSVKTGGEPTGAGVIFVVTARCLDWRHESV